MLGEADISVYYDHAEDVLTLSIVGITSEAVEDKSFYYKLRRLPQAKDLESSWRSDKLPAYSQGVFIVGHLSKGGVALQLRVQENVMLKRQKYGVLGEVLLCIPTLTQTTRRLKVSIGRIGRRRRDSDHAVPLFPPDIVKCSSHRIEFHITSPPNNVLIYLPSPDHCHSSTFSCNR